MVSSGVASVSAWEHELRGAVDLGEAEWGAVLRKADPELASQLGEDADINAQSEFGEAAEAYLLGRVSLDFPRSTHGDGVTVDVYRLPEGTVVLARSATYELFGPTGRVLGTDQIDEVLQHVYSFFAEGGDGRELGDVEYESGEEGLSPDADAYYEGEQALREAWANHGSSS